MTKAEALTMLDPAQKDIVVDLTAPLLAERARKILLLRLVPPCFGLFFAVLTVLFVGSEAGDFAFLGDPASLGFRLTLGVAVGVTLLALVVGALSTRDMAPGYALSRTTRLEFRMTREGLSIPTLLLTNPAQHHLVKRGVPVLQLPWGDIERVEVYADLGKARAQYLIRPRGESVALGTGALGITAPDGPRFGIRRRPLASCESAVLERLRSALGERVIIRDKSIGRS